MKRREQVSERIATKLRSEATLHHQIAESERELKSLRIATDSADFVLKHKDAAVSLHVRCMMWSNEISDDRPTCVDATDLEIYAHCPSPHRTSHI